MRHDAIEKIKRTSFLPRTRCTANERSVIEEKAKALGLSLSEYQRRCCLADNTIFMQEPLADKQLILELIRQGRNFNQYQKKLNSMGKDSPTEVKQVSIKIEKLLDGILD